MGLNGYYENRKSIQEEVSGSMRNVSVIVPIFHGKKYIDSMIAQLAKCAETGCGEFLLELLLVNDDPREPIGDFSSDAIAVKVLETEENRGIHGARVRGLEACTGDYVLFLDQDDRIMPDYFVSQFKHLGDGEAVVCKLLHEGKQYYDTRMPFEQVITRKFIISVKNSIISPGQVLLRKEKIPEVWKDIKLKNNGADDWLLWLCMLAEGCQFNLTPEILFEHVVEGNNESINAGHMIESERELYQVIAENKILVDEELEKLYVAVQNVENEHIRLLSKFQKMFFVYNAWMELQEQGISLEDYLERQGARDIAIYGFSYIGKRLYHSLSSGKIAVKYFIDMNAEYFQEEAIQIYKPDKPLPPVDMIIISLVEWTESIRSTLSALSEARLCTAAELFEDMRNTL